MDGESAFASPADVRLRTGPALGGLSEEDLQGLIRDQEAFVEAVLGRRLDPGHLTAPLARSVVADLAAAAVLVRLLGASQAQDYRIGKLDVRAGRGHEGRLAALAELRTRAAEGLALLQRHGQARRLVPTRGGPR